MLHHHICLLKSPSWQPFLKVCYHIIIIIFIMHNNGFHEYISIHAHNVFWLHSLPIILSHPSLRFQLLSLGIVSTNKHYKRIIQVKLLYFIWKKNKTEDVPSFTGHLEQNVRNVAFLVFISHSVIPTLKTRGNRKSSSQPLNISTILKKNAPCLIGPIIQSTLQVNNVAMDHACWHSMTSYILSPSQCQELCGTDASY